MPSTQRITPCLWFDGQAEEAANLYVSIFPNSRITTVVPYGDAGPGPKGSAMLVAFELDGQAFTALNGGPMYKFSEAISMMVDCKTQDEVDHYWDRLGEGGQPGRCGWLKDRFGVSWQIVPSALPRLMTSAEPARAGRIMAAVMTMDKLDIARLQAAHDGRD